MSPEPDDRHPDDLELDAERSGDARPEVSAHVASCAPCQQRLDLLRDLAQGLSERPAAIEVPEARELEILADAERASARARRRRTVRLAAIPTIAAAAALLLVVLLAQRSSSPTSSEAPRATAPLAGDVNRDHEVDILDAFVLARTIESGGATQPDWDFNHDQAIDALDVDCIARLAVSLTATLQGGPL